MLVVYLNFSLLLIFLAVCNETCRLKCSLTDGKMSLLFSNNERFLSTFPTTWKKTETSYFCQVFRPDKGRRNNSGNVSPIFPNINPHPLLSLQCFCLFVTLPATFWISSAEIVGNFATIIWKRNISLTFDMVTLLITSVLHKNHSRSQIRLANHIINCLFSIECSYCTCCVVSAGWYNST